MVTSTTKPIKYLLAKGEISRSIEYKYKMILHSMTMIDSGIQNYVNFSYLPGSIFYHFYLHYIP